MIIYRIFCGNFQGSASYTRYDEALQAAKWRTYCTGMEWTVRQILVP